MRSIGSVDHFARSDPTGSLPTALKMMFAFARAGRSVLQLDDPADQLIAEEAAVPDQQLPGREPIEERADRRHLSGGSA
jgi:hypothetical protein